MGLPGERLLEGGVHAAVARVDALRELVDVGGLELRDGAVVEDGRDDLVLPGEALEDVLGGGPVAGGGLGGGGEPEALEEDAPELLRGVDVERPAGELVDARDEPGELLREDAGVAREGVDVDADAGVLHVGEDGDERVLGLVVGAPRAALADDRLERAVEAQRHVGVLGRVFGDALRGDPVHRELALAARADERLDRDRVVAQELARERVHPVALRRVDDVVREHRVGDRRRDLDAERAQNVDVELRVVRALGLGRGEGRGERRADLGGGQARRGVRMLNAEC